MRAQKAPVLNISSTPKCKIKEVTVLLSKITEILL
jgi:hypothetical protein